MEFGICILNSISVRIEPSNKSEMTSQILFGEHFIVLEVKNHWLYVKVAFDGFKGWVDVKQVEEISTEYYEQLQNENSFFLQELVSFVSLEKDLNLISLGATLPNLINDSFLINKRTYQIDANTKAYELTQDKIIDIAFMYLNAPFLWGGKTPLGIDSAGFTQMVYKMNGYKLFRDVVSQSRQGEALSFIEESTPGDLAFFDDEEGIIRHVGIILANNFIIHASGKVRLDRLDQSGIYNEETNRHTHKLRIIKKMF